VNAHGPLRYSLDSSLGRLARYLRLLGHDAAWCRSDTLVAAVARARSQERALLTRSARLPEAGLAWPPMGGMIIRSDRWTEQLVEAAGRWPIFATARPFSRCADCNRALDRALLDEVRPKVPPHVAATRRIYRSCPACGRVFWSGTHTERILLTFRELARRCRQELHEEKEQNDDAGPGEPDPASPNR